MTQMLCRVCNAYTTHGWHEDDEGDLDSYCRPCASGIGVATLSDKISYDEVCVAMGAPELAEAERLRADNDDAKLGRELVAVLADHCGERGMSEGAVETLRRLIRERDALTDQHCGEWIGLSEYERVRAERDDTSRALDMERAAHRVTAARQERSGTALWIVEAGSEER